MLLIIYAGLFSVNGANLYYSELQRPLTLLNTFLISSKLTV